MSGKKNIEFMNTPEVLAAFNALLDETLGIHSSKTYGIGDSVEDEISSDIEHMEGYIDDFQIVDEAFLDEEVENDD